MDREAKAKGTGEGGPTAQPRALPWEMRHISRLLEEQVVQQSGKHSSTKKFMHSLVGELAALSIKVEEAHDREVEAYKKEIARLQREVHHAHRGAPRASSQSRTREATSREETGTRAAASGPEAQALSKGDAQRAISSSSSAPVLPERSEGFVAKAVQQLPLYFRERKGSPMADHPAVPKGQPEDASRREPLSTASGAAAFDGRPPDRGAPAAASAAAAVAAPLAPAPGTIAPSSSLRQGRAGAAAAPDGAGQDSRAAGSHSAPAEKPPLRALRGEADDKLVAKEPEDEPIDSPQQAEAPSRLEPPVKPSQAAMAGMEPPAPKPLQAAAAATAKNAADTGTLTDKPAEKKEESEGKEDAKHPEARAASSSAQTAAPAAKPPQEVIVVKALASAAEKPAVAAGPALAPGSLLMTAGPPQSLEGRWLCKFRVVLICAGDPSLCGPLTNLLSYHSEISSCCEADIFGGVGSVLLDGVTAAEITHRVASQEKGSRADFQGSLADIKRMRGLSFERRFIQDLASNMAPLEALCLFSDRVLADSLNYGKNVALYPAPLRKDAVGLMGRIYPAMRVLHCVPPPSPGSAPSSPPQGGLAAPSAATSGSGASASASATVLCRVPVQLTEPPSASSSSSSSAPPPKPAAGAPTSAAASAAAAAVKGKKVPEAEQDVAVYDLRAARYDWILANPDRYMQVNVEELLTDLRPGLKRILDFLEATDQVELMIRRFRKS